MITTFYPPFNFGGDGLFVYRLSKELASRGHYIDVVHCKDAYRTLNSNSPREATPHPSHPNVTVHSLESAFRVLSPLLTHQTGHEGLKGPRLSKILKERKFDVIHFHNVSLIGPHALSLGNAIKLYTMHEHWLVCPTHVLFKYNSSPCSTKNCLLCTLHSGRPPQWWRYTRLMDNMLKKLDSLIAPTHFTHRKHLEMGLNPDIPVAHIPHFLPTPSPMPDIGDPPHARPFFLFAGRLEKLKGVQVLIEAFRQYRACDLLIAGEGTYAKHLHGLAQGLEHIHFLGKLDQPSLRRLFRHATAVIISSIGYEVFPLVVLEAFAERTPLVVHDLGPLPEIVAQCGGGLTYKDEAGLIEALKTLHENPDLRRELGERGNQGYLKYWTADVHVTRYLSLIEQIGEKKRLLEATQR